MRTTIRDVARKLNLSVTTVSRALDGYDDVAESTRQLVTETALQMGYAPNRAARQLRRQRTETIGYCVPAFSAGFADPFFSEFIAGIGDEASAHNYDLLVTTAPPQSAAEQTQYERWIQGGRVDGVLINRVRLDDWRLQYLSAMGVPHVSLERSANQVDFVGVEVDPQSGMRDLVQHLAERGHERIAYIGATGDLKIEYDRRSAFELALGLASRSMESRLITQCDLTPDGGYTAAQQLLAAELPPTAIVCANDLAALGAMRAAHDRGLEVGVDIAIAGFDGIADAAYSQPPLTTLDQPVYQIARQLVSMLLALVDGTLLTERRVKITPTLLIRASTGV